MDKQQLHNLKNQVIDAFVRHEIGQELTMSDKAYDEKLAMIIAEDPSFNIYEFQPKYTNEDYIPHRSGIVELEKQYLHDIEGEWNKPYDDEPRLPKWDGSSIVIYYTNGKFTRIVSMRDKESGVDQTEKFQSFVPQTIDPSISFLRCECLIDMRLTDNARGKANGLVNSKYLEDQVEDLATLMCFAGHDLEGKKISYEDLIKILGPEYLIRENGVPKFLVSPRIEELTYSHGVAGYLDRILNFQFAIDGIVYYDSNFAYKYDYITSAITIITSINWSETEKEGFFATISVDPVELDGAEIRNPSSNGTPNMIRMGLGVGAKVEVIRSGLTIPKIINCITPAPIEFPKCPHCGYQMTEDDLVGSNLKCGNPHCSGRFENRKKWVQDYIAGGSVEEAWNWFNDNIEEGFMWLLNVSRFNYEAKRNYEKSTIETWFKDALGVTESDEVLKYIGEAYSWTDLQWYEAELNVESSWELLEKFLNTKEI